jgi:hypothetical protein
MLQAAYQQAQAAAATQLQLQVLQLTAAWVPAASAADQLSPSRHLLSEEENGVDEATTSAHATLCPRQQHSFFNNNSLCSTDPELHTVDAEAGDETAVESTSTRRLQAPAMGLASGWQAAVVEVSVTLPSSATSSYGITANGAAGMGVLQLGYALASNLQQQVDARQAPVDADSAGLQLQDVLLVQRLGMCGNGLCEVGERALLNAAGEAIKEAAAPCSQVRQKCVHGTQYCGRTRVQDMFLCLCSMETALGVPKMTKKHSSSSMCQCQHAILAVQMESSSWFFEWILLKLYPCLLFAGLPFHFRLVSSTAGRGWRQGSRVWRQRQVHAQPARL